MRTKKLKPITLVDESNYLGRRLRMRRIELGLKVIQVALIVSVTVNTVKVAESGGRVPRRSKLERYAIALQMDPEELVFWAEKSRQPLEYRRSES